MVKRYNETTKMKWADDHDKRLNKHYYYFVVKARLSFILRFRESFDFSESLASILRVYTK